jgi:hypothetical protein
VRWRCSACESPWAPSQSIILTSAQTPGCSPRQSSWSKSCNTFPTLAPEGWQKDHQPQPAVRLGPVLQDTPDQSVSAMESRSAWARLLAKVYEVDLIGGSWPRSGQREPPALHPLWFPDAGPRRHHRSAAGPANPQSYHQNLRSSPGTRRRFLELNLLSRPPLTGSLRLLGQHTTPLGAHGDRLGPDLRHKCSVFR